MLARVFNSIQRRRWEVYHSDLHRSNAPMAGKRHQSGNTDHQALQLELTPNSSVIGSGSFVGIRRRLILAHRRSY